MCFHLWKSWHSLLRFHSHWGPEYDGFQSLTQIFNSLWPSGTIWRQRSGSTLAQVMACCLMAPSHYLSQCWPLIRKVLWYSILLINCICDGIHHDRINTLRLRPNRCQFADAFSKCIFFMKMYKFWLKFHWSLFLGVQLKYSSIGSDKSLAPMGDKPLSEPTRWVDSTPTTEVTPVTIW